jgi:hypothetical protein
MNYTDTTIRINSLILGLSFLLLAQLHGQNVNLPLSAIGLGEKTIEGIVASRGMGGLNATYSSPYLYNYINPASLAYLRQTSLSISAEARRNQFETESNSETQWDGSLNYFYIAFPLQNYFNELYREKRSAVRMGAAIQIRPYTLKSYNLALLTEDPELGNLLNFINGQGESYKANLSFGAEYNQLALGFSGGVFFGSDELDSRFRYGDLFGSYQSFSNTKTSYLGFDWNLGLLYKLDLGKNKTDQRLKRQLTFGATVGGGNEIRALTDRVAGVEYFNLVDTLDVSLEDEERFELPLEYNFGLSYTDGERWTIGLNYSSSIWSESFESFRGQNFNNQFRLSGGAQFIPDPTAFGGYLEKIHYRLGLYLGEDYRFVNGSTLEDQGLTMGLGFPLYLPRQKVSFVDIALEYGELSTSDNTGLSERYFRINLGFTINDNTWFYKQKYQ